MDQLNFPFLTASILTPLAGAAAIALIRTPARARTIAAAAVATSTALSLETLREVTNAGGARLTEPFSSPLFADGLNAVPMALFPALALATLIIAPRQDTTPRLLAGILALVSATLAAYAAGDLIIFFAGWAGSALALLLCGRSAPEHTAQSRTGTFIPMIAGVASLLIAITLIGVEGSRMGIASPLSLSAPTTAASPIGAWALGFLLLAVVLRKGLFPAHGGVSRLLERGPLLLSALFVNAHMGAFLVARVAMPLLPELAATALPLLSGLALFTAAYAAVLGIVERKPRRLLAILMVSESSVILAGLATANASGITGALVHWIVLAVSTTILIGVYRAIEARIGDNIAGDRFLGLAEQLPRLAVFFAIGGLAMVGLPFTLGFAAGDLLLHGALEAHPWMGLSLPIATALNAFNIFRLFSMLFLGKHVIAKNGIPDALPRERWVLSACLVFLVWGGMAPNQVGALRTSAADRIAKMLSSAAGHAGKLGK